jgi:hypothetical protein
MSMTQMLWSINSTLIDPSSPPKTVRSESRSLVNCDEERTYLVEAALYVCCVTCVCVCCESPGTDSLRVVNGQGDPMDLPL